MCAVKKKMLCVYKQIKIMLRSHIIIFPYMRCCNCASATHTSDNIITAITNCIVNNNNNNNNIQNNSHIPTRVCVIHK